MDHIIAVHIVVHIHTAQTLAAVAPHIQHNPAVLHIHMENILAVVVLHIVQARVVVNTAHVLFALHMEHSRVVQNMDTMHVVLQDILIITIHAVKPILVIHVVLMDLLFIHIAVVLLMDIAHIKAELHVYSIMHALNTYVQHMVHVANAHHMEHA